MHNAIELEKPKIHDGFDQVISPMFGSTIPTVKKSVDHIPQKKIKEDITIDSEVISLADILEKKKQKEPVVKQEKLFVSKTKGELVWLIILLELKEQEWVHLRVSCMMKIMK